MIGILADSSLPHPHGSPHIGTALHVVRDTASTGVDVAHVLAVIALLLVVAAIAFGLAERWKRSSARRGPVSAATPIKRGDFEEAWIVVFTAIAKLRGARNPRAVAEEVFDRHGEDIPTREKSEQIVAEIFERSKAL